MKATRFVLKVVAVTLAVAAVACALVAYWDKISETSRYLYGKVRDRKAFASKTEYEDYVE